MTKGTGVVPGLQHCQEEALAWYEVPGPVQKAGFCDRAGIFSRVNATSTPYLLVHYAVRKLWNGHAT